MSLLIPLQGWVLHFALPKRNTCVLGISSCVLVGLREALHGGMGGVGPRPHRRGKGGRKPLLFLSPQIRISAGRFYVSLSLSSPPRNMHKNAPQILTSVAVVMAVRRPPRCITVCSWSLVLILCYFVYLETFARAWCARAYVFVRFRTVQYESNTILRFTH